MTYSIPYSSWSTPPQTGDEIAALGESNQIVGKINFEGGFTAITLYGDDSYTLNVIENLYEGETFTFEVWSAADKSTRRCKFKNWELGDGNFSNHKISVVGFEEDLKTASIVEMELYPNPGDGIFILDIVSTIIEDATITLYEVSGKRVYFEKVKVIEGIQNIKLDLSSLEIGTYTLSLIGDSINKQTKLVIID